MTNLKLVVVETPYHANTQDELLRNLKYARACARDCLGSHDEAPLLSHLLYTQEGILNDHNAEERLLGIAAGLAWGAAASATIVYTDLGISEGMRQGIEDAIKHNRPVIYRQLPYPFVWHPERPYAI